MNRLRTGSIMRFKPQRCDCCNVEAFLVLKSDSGSMMWLCEEHVRAVLTAPGISQTLRGYLERTLTEAAS